MTHSMLARFRILEDRRAVPTLITNPEFLRTEKETSDSPGSVMDRYSRTGERPLTHLDDAGGELVSRGAVSHRDDGSTALLERVQMLEDHPALSGSRLPEGSSARIQRGR